MFKGHIKVISWVRYYRPDQVDWVNDWQPTQTFYYDWEAKLKEEEAKNLAELEKLNQELERALNET